VGIGALFGLAESAATISRRMHAHYRQKNFPNGIQPVDATDDDAEGNLTVERGLSDANSCR
jgi:hypothetical protein